jgi:hypothetical protein
MKQKTISDLNQLYDEADSIDKEIFAEQRSNVLLIAGEHYSKRLIESMGKMRSGNDQGAEKRLRLTKNHTYRIVRGYVSNILDYAPGTAVEPQRDSEVQDVKAAELNQSVWENYFKAEYDIERVIWEACQDFCGVGEVCYKLSYDYTLGKVLGYEGQVDEEGNPVMQETGNHTVDPMTGEATPEMVQAQDEERPIMEGRFVLDRIFAANLLRHPSAKSMPDSPCHIIRHMVSIKDLKARYAADKDKLGYIEESSKDEFVVFDSNKYNYSTTKGQCLVREFYWRPCQEYPQGYFQITTSCGILEEGPLPFGIYPIKWAGFDEYNTSPRARSIVKIIRPFQAEINRASSQQAMQQLTMGDDKIFYQAGTKVEQGAVLPGIRGFKMQGPAPTVIQGRDGGQFTEYIQNNVAEVDRAAMVSEINIEKDAVDPLTALFQSVSQKKKYSLYIKKFEAFLVDLTTTLLDMGRYYIPDSCLIPSIGSAEMVNMEEYRNSTKLSYLIKVVPREDTMETQLGKQVMIQHALQYVGGQLSQDTIGRLLKAYPYGNFDKIFGDMTIDEENIDSDILMLERGGMPRLGPYDNSEQYVKRLSYRMKKKDFPYLAPPVQQNFQNFLQQHEDKIAAEAQKLKAMESDYIPTSGSMIACDMYVPDTDPTKAPKRVRVPYDALQYLLNTLKTQGTSQDSLEAIQNPAAVGQIAEKTSALNHPQPPPGAAGLSPQGVDSQHLQAKIAQGLAQGAFQ